MFNKYGKYDYLKSKNMIAMAYALIGRMLVFLAANKGLVGLSNIRILISIYNSNTRQSP